MPSPIAHASMLVWYGAARRRGLLRGVDGRASVVFGAMVFVALVLPDIDFLFRRLWPGTAFGAHGFATHSLWVTAAVGFLSAIVWGLVFRRPCLRPGLVLTAAYWSHILMDTVTWQTRGVAMFWPIWDGRVAAPFPLFYGARHSQGAPVTLHLITLVTELAFAAVIFVLARSWARRANKSTESLA